MAHSDLTQPGDDPTRVPIEKKESIRWLENLLESTESLNDLGAVSASVIE